jgi:hypothetical protein
MNEIGNSTLIIVSTLMLLFWIAAYGILSPVFKGFTKIDLLIFWSFPILELLLIMYGFYGLLYGV